MSSVFQDSPEMLALKADYRKYFHETDMQAVCICLFGGTPMLPDTYHKWVDAGRPEYRGSGDRQLSKLVGK